MPPGIGRVRSVAWPSAASRKCRSAMSIASGAIVAGSKPESMVAAAAAADASVAPVVAVVAVVAVPAGPALAPPPPPRAAEGLEAAAPAVPPELAAASPLPRSPPPGCQCSRANWPLSTAPSWSGTNTLPARAGPSTSTRRPCTSGRSFSRVCGKLPPSNCSCSAITSTWRSGRPPSPPRARPIHSSASSAAVCPVTTSPDAGGGASTEAAPSLTRTPVCPFLRCARTATRSPKATSMAPLPSGRASSTVAGKAWSAGLASGAGRSRMVPTRFDCRRRVPTLSPTACRGKATSSRHGERPRTRGASQSSSGARANRSAASIFASSEASKAWLRSRTCRPECRASTPSWPR